MRKSRAFIAAAAMSVAASLLARAAPEVRTSYGVVSWAKEANHILWFELVRIDQRFVVDERKLASVDGFFAALKDSNSTARSMSVEFFVDGGAIDPGADKPSYFVRGIVFDGQRIDVAQVPPPPDPNAVPLDRDVAAASLARGIALAGDADEHASLAALTAAIDSKALDTTLRALAFKSRSDVYEEHALQRAAGSERDAELFAAYGDALQWQALAPDSPEATRIVGRLQSHLGGYPEALATYASVIRRWPKEDVWARIGIAVTYRRMQQYDKALAALDEFAGVHPNALGMPYYFHRGWILGLAGRNLEAVAALTDGLKSQPDYAPAFRRRACSLAQLGRLQEAIADLEQVIKLSAAFVSGQPDRPSVVQDKRRDGEVLALLRSAYDRDRNAKLDAPCTGYYNFGDGRRDRSRLLPPEPANDQGARP